MTEPLYRGEAICKRWGDSSSAGRTVTLQLEDGGEHPFRGYEGERFAIVVVPIGNDEKPMKKFMGDAPTREDGVEGGARAGFDDHNATNNAVTSPAKPKKRWHEMPPSQRAALLTRDPEFWEYLETCEVSRPTTAMAADASLKHLCNVDSKSSILPGTTAHARFVDLEGDFMAWRQARQHGAA